MTPLRERMIQDLEIRNYSAKTIEAYVYNVANFAKFFRKSPEILGPEEIRNYQLYLVNDRKVSWAVLTQTVCGLRFLYGKTLKREMAIEYIPFAKKPRMLPVVLSKQEVARFLGHVENLKHRTVLETMYAAGLRVSEALNLQIGDIDSERMVLRIRQGKGKKDRYAPLSPTLLARLRAYWKTSRPRSYLFAGRDSERPLGVTSVQKACGPARKLAGISKPVTTHSRSRNILERKSVSLPFFTRGDRPCNCTLTFIA